MIKPSRYFFLILFTIFPHLSVFPADIVAILALLLTWAALFCYKNILRPSVWVLRAITLSSVLYCYLRYGSLVNPDAASAVLALITVLKLFETQSYRDAMALLLVSLIVVMSYLIQSYSLLASAYMIIVFVLVIYFMMELQRKKYFLKQNSVKWSDIFSLEMMVALPLLVALFVFFPRFTTRFGSGERQVQTIGFSDSIELGQLINLSQSTEVAFKVRYINQKKPPAYGELYFRGAVLTRNKDMSWRKSAKSAEFVQRYDSSLKPEYQVLLPPRNQKNLFTLDKGEITDISPRMFLFKKKTENIYYTNNPIDHNVSYSVASTLSLPSEFSKEELELTESTSKLLTPYLAMLDAETDEQKIENILLYFKNNSFSYSTEVPGYKNIGQFLETKIGFCEHYASATVILARLLKVPSRVVVGFMGGETNPFDDTLIVRDKFAHAWAEVFLQGKGWVRVDPTSVVYPQRMENVLVTAAGQQRFYESFFSNGLLFLESINNQFELFLMNFNSDSQWNLLTRLSDFFQVKAVVIFLLVPLFFGLLTALIWWIWRLEARDSDALGNAFAVLLKKLSKKGFSKHDHEGALEFKQRIEKTSGVPTEYLSLIQTYIQLRFAIPPDLKQINRLRAQIKALR